jgi:tetratricopeptide (TPR) repeat protein
MYKEAITEFQKMLSLFRDRDTLASLGYVYAVLGKQDEARKVLAELKERGKQEYVPAYDVAIIYVGLGETDQAFEWLERAFEERSYYLSFLRVDPVLDGLRSAPRIAGLARRVGLAN